MNFTDVIYEYHAAIALGIIILIAITLLVLHNKEEILKQFILYAVTKVQETWGSDMGKVKFAEAYCMIREKFPVFTIFIKEDFLKKLIENALEDLKNAIKANTSNKDASEWNDIEKSIMSQIPEEKEQEEEEENAELTAQ